MRLLRQEQLYRAQQKRITQIEAAIKRFEEAAAFTEDPRHARQARHRHKMLERMDKIERPQEGSRMRLELGGWRGSNKVLDVQRVDKWFEDPAAGELRVVLEGVSFQVWHGERVGLVGPNGAGKSVLFRCVLGEALSAGNLPAGIGPANDAGAGRGGRSLFEQPDGGVIRLGPSVKIGYYAQQHETLHPDWTLVQEIRDVKAMYETDAVAILQRFLFDYYAAQKQVHHLSGGERSRLQLAKLMLSDVNFLMLDEPTNNLDIPSSEVLENALEEFNGTVLVISHDRYFLDRIVDRVVVLEGGAAREIVGGYSDYAGRVRWAPRRAGRPAVAPTLAQLHPHLELALKPVRLLLTRETLRVVFQTRDERYGQPAAFQRQAHIMHRVGVRAIQPIRKPQDRAQAGHEPLFLGRERRISLVLLRVGRRAPVVAGDERHQEPVVLGEPRDLFPGDQLERGLVMVLVAFDIPDVVQQRGAGEDLSGG